jgi:Ca2+-binding EF-hand superfamily protein
LLIYFIQPLNSDVGNDQGPKFINSSQLQNPCSMALFFRLFGVKKRGWGAKLIGFREVLLATEGISKMSKPDEILRWIFRVYDQHAVGEISVYKIESMMNSILW